MPCEIILINSPTVFQKPKLHVILSFHYSLLKSLFKFYYLFSGGRKCRELWPVEHVIYERIYNIFLDLILFMLPLIILCFAYFSIIKTLYQGIKNVSIPHSNSMNNNNEINEIHIAEHEEVNRLDDFKSSENSKQYSCKSAETVSHIPAIKEDYGKLMIFLAFTRIDYSLKIIQLEFSASKSPLRF